MDYRHGAFDYQHGSFHHQHYCGDHYGQGTANKASPVEKSIHSTETTHRQPRFRHSIYWLSYIRDVQLVLS